MKNVLNKEFLGNIIEEYFEGSSIEEIVEDNSKRDALAKIVRKNFDTKVFIILQGVPGSGKSTLCKIFSAIYGDDAIICPDTLREMCGAIDYNDEGEATAISQETDNVVFGIFYPIVKSRVARGKPVILDATHTTAKSMSRYKEMLDGSGYTVEVHKCECSLDTVINRNTNRGYKNVPQNVVRSMHSRLSTFRPEGWYTYFVHNSDN